MDNNYHNYITAAQDDYSYAEAQTYGVLENPEFFGNAQRREPARGPNGEIIQGGSAGLAPAMAYIPFQSWGNLYAPEVGFQRGTLFQALDKPFLGEEAIPRG